MRLGRVPPPDDVVDDLVVAGCLLRPDCAKRVGAARSSVMAKNAQSEARLERILIRMRRVILWRRVALERPILGLCEARYSILPVLI